MSEFVCFVDLETGGVQEWHPDIQLAAIAVDESWNEVDSFERKILFDELTADVEALRINHYNAAVWREQGKPEAQVVAEFSAFLKRFASIPMTSRAGKPYYVAQLAGHKCGNLRWSAAGANVQASH